MYQEAKAASANSFDQIFFNYDEEEAEDYPSNSYLQARVSRRGSSRASRYSRYITITVLVLVVT